MVVGASRVSSPRTLAAVQGLISLCEVIVKNLNIVLYCLGVFVPVVMQFNLQANNQTAGQIKPLWPPIRSWNKIRFKYGGIKNVTGNNCFASASLQVILLNNIRTSTAIFYCILFSQLEINLIGKDPQTNGLYLKQSFFTYLKLLLM